MCQGFSHFSGFSHQITTSSTRVNLLLFCLAGRCEPFASLPERNSVSKLDAKYGRSCPKSCQFPTRSIGEKQRNHDNTVGFREGTVIIFSAIKLRQLHEIPKASGHANIYQEKYNCILFSVLVWLLCKYAIKLRQLHEIPKASGHANIYEEKHCCILSSVFGVVAM